MSHVVGQRKTSPVHLFGCENHPLSPFSLELNIKYNTEGAETTTEAAFDVQIVKMCGSFHQLHKHSQLCVFLQDVETSRMCNP